ncbi:MAG: thioredoxin-like domain-containing protein [Paludibacteraceae bacterium]
MKLKLSVILLAMSTLIGCQQKEFEITGTFENPAIVDSTAQVFLSERINREWVNRDSVKIQNGKFKFEGTVDSVKVAYLRFVTTSGNKKTGDFILENGKIKAVVDTNANITVKGTPQNEVLALFYSKEKNIYKNRNAIIQKLTSAASVKVTNAIRDSINTQTKKENEEQKKNALDFMTEHVNTMAGSHIFMSNFYMLSIEEKDALFAKMDTKSKSVKRIADIIAATEVEKKTSAGNPYVNFSQTTPDGKSVRVSDYIGKTDYLLIDFWASWCPDCVRSFPQLTAFYAKNKGPGFDILGISLDKEKTAWINGIQKYGLKWNHMSDLKYWDSEGAKLYAVNSIPTTVLIDKTGKIVGRNMDLNEIQNLLNQ